MNSYSYDRRSAQRLTMGPGEIDRSATKSLSNMKLRSGNNGSLQDAVVSAGFFAKKLGRTCYVYSGNSFGHSVWRVSVKSGEYLDPINNTGPKMLSVTENGIVSWHELKR